jgi:threonine aldolase
MAAKRGFDVAALRNDGKALLPRVGNQRLDELHRHALPAHFRRNEGMFGNARAAPRGPGQLGRVRRAAEFGAIGAMGSLVGAGDGNRFGHLRLLLAPNTGASHGVPMQFLSDNAAAVHPRVWDAMREVDTPDTPYDTDRLSRKLDDAFAVLFGQEVAALWVASGTAANCLALATMVQPHGAVVCHREAHIEMDEGGAPGFYLHGAKLVLAGGEGAKLTPRTLRDALDPIRDDVHQVQPHAVSVTQASEYGCCYRPQELTALHAETGPRGLRLHMDGARFANAVAFLNVPPAEAAGPADALSFGCVKNGAMNAEAIVFFDPALADVARYRRKRAGHLQSKGRFLAAQVLALLEDDLWLHNAAHANAAAAEIGRAAHARLLHPVEANEVFLRCTAAEREALRLQGFGFYDWGPDAARFVAAWDTRQDDALALARAIAAL